MIHCDALITDIMRKWYLNKAEFTQLLHSINSNYVKLEMKSGVKRATIYNILNGTTKRPQPDTLDKIVNGVNGKLKYDDEKKEHYVILEEGNNSLPIFEEERRVDYTEPCIKDFIWVTKKLSIEQRKTSLKLICSMYDIESDNIDC